VIDFANAGTNADVRGAWRPDFSGASVATTPEKGTIAVACVVSGAPAVGTSCVNA
jgi:hypothetical protein